MTDKEYEQLKNFYTQVEESLSIEDYLDILEQNGFKSKKSSEGYLLKTCCHNIDDKDAHWNLCFYTETRTFYCWSECQCSYNIYTLLEKRWQLLGINCRNVDVLKWICNYKGIPFNFTIETKIKPKYNWKKGLIKYLNKSCREELTVFDKHILNDFPQWFHQDWLDYGLSEETLEKYNIRYYPFQNSIVIPVYNRKGDLVGIRQRNMDKTKDIKYIPLSTLNGTSYKFPTNQVFYGENYNLNEIKRRKKVILVESEKAVLKSEEWFKCHSIALGLFGSNLGKDRINDLISWGVKEVIIAFDSDFHEIGDNDEYNAFEEKVMKLYNQLAPYFDKIYCFYNNLGFDMYKQNPFDMTREQYEQLWESKEVVE